MKNEINFNIIEGDYSTKFPYEDLKKDYYETKLSVKEIQSKHGINTGQWSKFIKKLKEDGLPLRGNQSYYRRAAKYYSHDKKYGKYLVYREFNKHRIYFGRYDTEKEAQERVAELMRNGWNGYETPILE